MSLAQGHHYLAIPGPSVMPDRVLRVMQRPAPNIYTGELVDMVDTIVPDLKAVARSTSHVAMYISNGHGVWEAALVNTIRPGDKVLVPVTGMFCEGWAHVATALGLEVELLDFGKRAPIDPAALTQALAQDTRHQIKAVLAVQADTSSSALSDIAAVRSAIDAAGHPALLMVDSIASLGCDRFEMDAWGVDVMIAGCQKGLMSPPGMAFVYFSDKAAATRDALGDISPYWDWKPRVNPELFYRYFDGTAPTHHLYALREALDMMKEEGLENIWRRHDILARAVWAAFETWGSDGPLELNIRAPEHRSRAVTTLRIGSPHGTALRDWVTANAGLTLGIGLGMAPPGDPAWHGFFRLGHMGYVNAQMIMGALGAIDAGLKALDLPHAPGALEAASALLAKA